MAGVLTFGHLLAAALLSGVTTGSTTPAYSAMLPNVVEAAHLQAANGLKVSCGRCSTRPRASADRRRRHRAGRAGQAIVLAGIASVVVGVVLRRDGSGRPPPRTHRHRQEVGAIRVWSPTSPEHVASYVAHTVAV